MVDSISRFLEHPEDKVVKHIKEAFGSKDAKEIAKGSGNNRIMMLRK